MKQGDQVCILSSPYFSIRAGDVLTVDQVYLGEMFPVYLKKENESVFVFELKEVEAIK